jgi:hypothetical protein
MSLLPNSASNRHGIFPLVLIISIIAVFLAGIVSFLWHLLVGKVAYETTKLSKKNGS